MSMFLYRLARWSVRHRWLVLSGWLAVVIAVIAVAQLSGGATNNTFSIPGAESQQVVSVLEHQVPSASGATTQVVFATRDTSVSGATERAAITQTLSSLAGVAQVRTVTDPFRTGTISRDGHVALATVSYDAQAADVRPTTIAALDPAVSAARRAGVEVEFSGAVYPTTSEAVNPESLGILVALVILVLTFGSLVAGGLPIVTAVFGVVISLMGATVLASVFDVASSATAVGAMLGIACGIDYALFIVSRYREHLLGGHAPDEAAGRAAGTAGSSVVFAGLSVIVALCGLTVVGIPFLTTLGLIAAGAVLMALLVALTLLPALLGFAGHRVARFSRLPGLRRARRSTHIATSDPAALTGSRWAAWVVRHRVPVLIACVIALGVLAIPATQVDLGLPGAGSRPTTDTSRRAYDLTTEHFGPGYNGTLTVLAENVGTPPGAAAVAGRLGAVDGVATARVATLSHGLAVITVVPTTGPNDPATADLVTRIRDNRTQLEGNDASHVLVGGVTATDIDVSTTLGHALPVFLLTVAGLALLLLTFAFRTILVPITSIIGFLLSAGAAFGAQVAVFQWGWLDGLFGVTRSQTLSFLPVILIAIVFGLSSDYEVFVVSRIKEHFTEHGDARRAVVIGTGQSARVVTAAALIMTSVFASFLFAGDPITKAIGFSFAVGVLVDAFVVRLTLVPAIMAIVGARIWYHPRWFAAHVPDPDIEGARLGRALPVPPARTDALIDA